MNVETHSQLANFIWSICNLLRGPYKRNEYRKVILPLTCGAEITVNWLIVGDVPPLGSKIALEAKGDFSALAPRRVVFSDN
jgi:hypothetical protein